MSSRMHPVAAIVGVTIVIDVLMVVSGMSPNVLLVTALGGLVGVGLWFLVDTANVAVGVAGAPSPPATRPTARADRRVMQLRTGLVNGRPDRPSLVQLRSTLVELIADQLQTVHHVDLTEDPDAARALIGEDLYDFIVDVDSAVVLATPRKLDHILTLIERI